MSAPAAAGGGRAKAALWIGLAVAGLVVIAIATRSDPEQAMLPYSAQSTDPSGAKALAELVRSFDGTIEVDDEQPPDRAEVALGLGFVVPESEDAVQSWRQWVRAGGTLVLTEPVEGLTPELAASGGLRAPADQSLVVEAGTCDVELFEPVRRVSLPYARYRWEVPPGMGSCFGDGDEALVTVEELGEGRIVSIGSPEVFTNASLDEADNAVLATQLLVPVEGTAVAWLEYPLDAGEAPGSGILGVLNPAVSVALWQLVIAFVVYAVVRARRLGAPIAEPLPTQIAGSELTEAVGRMLRQTRDPQRAAAVLRADLVAQLARGYGVAPDDPTVLAEVVSARSGVDHDRLLAVIAGPPVTDDASLVALADAISSLRQEVLHGART